MNNGPILETRGVTMRFGGLAAVKSLTMQVSRGTLYGLIGPNGAGKTTVFNVLTGVYCPTEGEIDFDGARVDGKKPYEITRLGVARTFQNIRLFADMTVLQNVMTARHLRSRQLLADAVLGLYVFRLAGPWRWLYVVGSVARDMRWGTFSRRQYWEPSVRREMACSS